MQTFRATNSQRSDIGVCRLPTFLGLGSVWVLYTWYCSLGEAQWSRQTEACIEYFGSVGSLLVEHEIGCGTGALTSYLYGALLLQV